jgi:hypothetical protein
MKELKRRANARLWAALQTGHLAKIFGDGEQGRKIAAMICGLNQDLEPGTLANWMRSPLQSSAPFQPNLAESSPIKPNQTPPPAREASPQTQPDHQDLNLDLAPGMRAHRNQSPPQPAAPIQPNPTQSNRIKPDQTKSN